MQLLFDLFPVVIFFVAYKLADIYIATGAIIVAVILQIGLQYGLKRKVSTMALVSSVLVLVFGGLTLLIHDKAFIQWKPTVVNWLFAVAFLASQFVGGKPIVQRMLGEQIHLPAAAWTRLNLSWVAFFVVMGAANIYVAYTFAESVWVNFKLFGVLGLTVVFVVIQGIWLASKGEDVKPTETIPPGQES
jgi:intracellular septation protein